MASRSRAKSHRWTANETLSFIQICLDNIKDSLEKFEKPTIQRFYESLQPKLPITLQGMPWTGFKNKMNSLKGSYVQAVNWRKNTGNGVLEEDGEETVEDFIISMCPQFHLLDQIFSHRSSINPPHIVDTEELETEYLEEAAPSYNANFPIHERSNAVEQEDEFFQPEVVHEDTAIVDDAEESRPKRRKTSGTSGAASALVEMQEIKMEAETKKFELEVSKWNKELEWKEQEFQLKEKEFELKNHEIGQRKEIRMMELEFERETLKMKLETEERIKKYELELKYQNK